MDELIKQRYIKLNNLKKLGISPYSNEFKSDTPTISILYNFDEFKDKKVKVAGRIISIRQHGKATFAHIDDGEGRLQIYFKVDKLGNEKYEQLQLLDIGDFIGIEGVVFKTKTGEVTVLIEDYKILSKSLRVLPEKWHGLQDIEIRFRKRYLDLIANKEVKEIFHKRIRIINLIRGFLNNKGFLEVETPMFHPLPGGAEAAPFITYHNALNMNLYLRIAPELYLKRLIIGGMNKIYEMNRNFRNEGISTWHNPEFTMLEVYATYWNYTDMMELTEELIHHLVVKLNGIDKINYQDTEIVFSLPFERISYIASLKKYVNIDVREIKSKEAAIAVAKNMGVAIVEEEQFTLWQVINEIFEKKVENKLIQPTFVYDYPVDISPLAMRKKDDEELTQRFELFIYGKEIANAFSELTDPLDQRERFKKQKNIDEDFLQALEYGMPPTAGLGVGIDRLCMILTNSSSIREVIFFPTLRPK